MTKAKVVEDKPRLPTIKPTEWKAVAKLLAEPADSAELLAKAIIHELDSLRGKTQQWAVILQMAGDWAKTYTFLIYGPFPTKKAAHSASEALRATYGASVGVRVGRLVGTLTEAPWGQSEGVAE